MSTNLTPSVANAQLMARYAVAFNIGADILNKGNRAVDKYLGSEQMSGDTVQVPIWDSGEVYHNMDLTGKDLAVERGSVPVKVMPLVAASAVTVEDLTLSIKSPEHMVKRVVKLADTANLIAFRTLVEQSQAHVVASGQNTTDKSNDIRFKSFAASATAEGSKLGGQTYGCTHPMTWKNLIASLATNFAPNDRVGQRLYTSELGDYLGYKWCKGSSMSVITASLTTSTFGTIVLTHGSDVFGYQNEPTGNYYDGYMTDPFYVEGLWNCDAIGLKTGERKTLRAVYRADMNDWVLTTPIYLKGARQNAWADPSIMANTSTTTALQTQPYLTPNVEYYAPAVIWKEADFLVAVKGLEKFYAQDSFTIPTEYKDKGILPLRGTVSTDVTKASTMFRVDVLLGTSMYQGISSAAVYIPIT